MKENEKWSPAQLFDQTNQVLEQVLPSLINRSPSEVQQEIKNMEHSLRKKNKKCPQEIFTG